MIRRNIDTSLGLVNGTLCEVDSVKRSVTSTVQKVNVKLPSEKIHAIERVKVTFEISKGVYVEREQFPLILSYAITVHKSQGISLKTVVIDAGLHNFAWRQIYVALSRVTSLKGLHLINYDPSKVSADKQAILQYNNLRKKFRPDLLPYALPLEQSCDKNYVEQVWAVPRALLEVQENNDPLDDLSNLKGFHDDGFSSFANVTLILLLSNNSFRHQIQKLPDDHILKITLNNYIANNLRNLMDFVLFAGHEYTIKNQNIDVSQFIQAIFKKCNLINDITTFLGVYIKSCNVCHGKSIEEFISNILNVPIKNDTKITYDLKELMDFQRSLKKMHTLCQI